MISKAINAIKITIKSKIPSLNKFYSLLLLKDMLSTENEHVVYYFIKKLLSRLFILVDIKDKRPISIKGENCLDEFYKPNLNNKKEIMDNKNNSAKFYILLIECW